MTEKRFKQVDVFTNVKYKGNPVAVFFDAEHLTTEEMQSIANWTNLSETTFVLNPTTPEADYRLRIFTPQNELPFAGHPTIGSCYAVIEAGLIEADGSKPIIQECGAGLVKLTYEPSTNALSFKLPSYKHLETASKESLPELATALGLSDLSKIKNYASVNDGPEWFTIQLTSGEDVLELEPDYSVLSTLSKKINAIGFSVFGKYTDGRFEARNFAPAIGVNEDPVCGSGAGADASLLAEFEDFEGNIEIRQGRRVGRDGRLLVKVLKEENNGNSYTIYVGGNAVTVVNGTW